MSELTEILEQYLKEKVDELKRNVPKASGKTSDAIRYEIKQIGDEPFNRIEGTIYAPKYIFALEHGRKPTSSGSNTTGKTLRESILDWIRYKGFTFPMISNTGNTIKNDVQLSWAIAIKIHKEGTELYRRGGKSGVITNVFTNEDNRAFISAFNQKATRIFFNELLKYHGTPSFK